MKVLVTGATGFIGASLVRELLKDGATVRVLARPESNLDNLYGLDVEICSGDLRDQHSISKAMAGCDTVFHAAADYRLWTRDVSSMYDINVGGTEATPVGLADMVGHYKKSKFLAEREAESFIARGLPLIIVNPSTPVGPLDIKPTPTGKIIVDYLNRKMPAYLDTGLNIIDVEDCARGHILAAKRGRTGEKYILGNRNLSLKEIFATLENITGLPAPKVRLPYFPILCAAYANEALSACTGKEPLIPLAGVQMARKFMFFDSAKAVRELGLPQGPIDAALAKAVEWFRKTGYCR